MKNHSRSTIHPLASWLRKQAPALPWSVRWSFLCLPARCYFCDRAGDLGHVDLCAACLGGLPWLAREPCRASLLSLFAYGEPVDEALKALKYRGDRRAARLFGTLLAATVTAATDDVCRLPDALMPIPLHPERLKDRGFNQSTLIARHVGVWLARPVILRGMIRIRATPSQTGLPAVERRRNVAGAFFVAPDLQAQCARRGVRRVALIDDVATTGATLEAASSALREVIDVEVQCWSVARAIPANTVAPT